MTDWLEIAASIFLWMAISYTVLYLGASLVALLMMRRHPYVVLFVLPLLGGCLVVAYYALLFFLSYVAAKVFLYVINEFSLPIVKCISFSHVRHWTSHCWSVDVISASLHSCSFGQRDQSLALHGVRRISEHDVDCSVVQSIVRNIVAFSEVKLCLLDLLFRSFWTL